jgi:hypothetical protein
MSAEIVGYTYDSSIHCSDCYSKRWTRKISRIKLTAKDVEALLSLNEGQFDSAGDPPFPIWSAEELVSYDNEGRGSFVRCIDCGSYLF